MAYLKNRAVNRLNIHFGLFALALNGAGVFFVVFLLKAGVPTPYVFGAIALIVTVRFICRPLVLMLAPRTGLRTLLIFGTILCSLQYPILAEVHGLDWMLLAFCLTGALGDTFYWTNYHAYFATLGDSEHRGHQIGAREAIGSIAAIIGPLLGGWALISLGPRVAFGAAAIVNVLAALPLLGAPEVPVKKYVPGVFRAALPGIMLFAADAWIAVGYIFAWQIALFLSLGESFSAFGVAMALAALVGAISGLILGKHIDAGRGGGAVWLTFASLVAVTVLRAFSTTSAELAVIANALGALVGCLYIPTLMTSVYNQAKRSPCPLRFHVAAEGGWDIGCAAACLVVAGLSAAGVPLAAGILSSLAGTVLFLAVLRNYYANGESFAEAPVRQSAPGV